MGMDIFFVAVAERGNIIIGEARKDYALVEFVTGRNITEIFATEAGFLDVEVSAEDVETWYGKAYGVDGTYDGWREISTVQRFLTRMRSATLSGYPVRMQADW
jgi:hypothetical protein